jgi:transcriptional regulator with XRE-family HTH domain
VILQPLCAARGLTLAQLAERAGVPLATVVHLDAGTTRAQPVTLRRLATALGLAPAALQDALSAARRRAAAERNRTTPDAPMKP